MSKIQETLDTPWKLWNEMQRWLVYPLVRIIFTWNGIPWGRGWRFYGMPIIQKHRSSQMKLGDNFQLRSTTRSNPLGPNHAVVLCTWLPEAVLEIGDHFAMTGGGISAAERITIGKHVTVGANSTIIDTDFHPMNSEQRRLKPDSAETAPVVIGDDVFIGMNCLILKGVTLGRGCVVGAGSVVTRSIPDGYMCAGNPAQVIRQF